MFKKMMICLDGSELAEQVLPVAVETARSNNSSIVLFRSVFEYTLAPPGIPGYTSAYVPSANFVKTLANDMDTASKYLENIAETIRKETGLDVTSEISLGTPGKAIINYAEDNKVDCIAIATHGHGGLERAVFGSTADHILKRSHLPNLVLKPKSIEELDEKLLEKPPVRKILVPLDGSHLAEQILPYAREQARLFSGKLVLVQVLDTPESEVTISPRATAPTAEKENAFNTREEKDVNSYLMSIADSYQQSAIDAEWAVVHGGNPEKTIVEYAKRNEFDMIAMCTHGRGGLNRLVFGSVADHVLRNAGTPLLIIRPKHDDL